MQSLYIPTILEGSKFSYKSDVQSSMKSNHLQINRNIQKENNKSCPY